MVVSGRLHSSGLPIRQHPHLYEINTWVWLEALSQNQGEQVRLGDVPDQEWDALQALGFDLVWLMGVWQRSPEGQRIARTEKILFAGYDRALPGWKQEDVIGSPYAIRAYEPDPRIGSWEDLENTQKKLHQRGMGLILDYVPNHTARDHGWVQKHPDFYVQGTPQRIVQTPNHFFQPCPSDQELFIAHGKDPNFPPWTDTAQLNYYNAETRSAMLQELKKLSAYCDGVRCDMAMLILNRILAQTWGDLLQPFSISPQEFWSEVREALPHLLLIGEVYWDLEWELQQLGFDYTYDKRLYDLLRHNGAQGIRDHLTASPAFQDKLVRFLENHDEARSAESFGTEKLGTALTIMSTLPGMRLYHQGQFEGRRLRIPVQLRKASPEMIDAGIRQWHETILAITSTPIFHEGDWTLLHVYPHEDETYRHVIACSWKLNRDIRLIVVNMSPSFAQGRIMVEPLTSANTKEGASLVFSQDLLNSNEHQVTHATIINKGLLLRVGSFGAHIFACKQSRT